LGGRGGAKRDPETDGICFGSVGAALFIDQKSGMAFGRGGFLWGLYKWKIVFCH